VAQDIRDIFNAPDRKEAERLLAITVEKYRSRAGGLTEVGQLIFKYSVISI